MPRLLFSKEGNAVWISHLDLMRVFQRAFKRANLLLKHTQGFNPRPSVSIALPLSVGVESQCELLDFDLDGEPVSLHDICSGLNNALPEGIRVLDAFDSGRKIRDLKLLECNLSLEYDNGIPEHAAEAINALLTREELIVTKKTKSGPQDQNIIPMIRRMQIVSTGERELQLNPLIYCQNPTLNPAQIVAAIGIYLPEFKPDHYRCKRIEIFDEQEIIFR